MGLSGVIKQMLEGGVHFGHLKRNWNPKMSKFVFGRKKNISIINLEKTAQKLEEAKDFLREKAKSGEVILFVGTKRQIRPAIKELAATCKMPYVDQKWVGGLLTNFPTIKKRLKRYLELIQMRESGQFNSIPGKEVVRLNREISRMDKKYSGLTALEGLPECVVVVDPGRERACVKEAIKLAIPLVALIDTDSNPDEIDYPIPGNDDAIRSVRFVINSLVEAILQGQESFDRQAKAAAEAKAAVEEEIRQKQPDAEVEPGQEEESKNPPAAGQGQPDSNEGKEGEDIKEQDKE